MQTYTRKQYIHIPIEVNADGLKVIVSIIDPHGLQSDLIADKQASVWGDNYLYELVYVPNEVGLYRYLIRVFDQDIADGQYTTANDKAKQYLVAPNRFDEFYVQLALMDQPLPQNVLPGTLADYIKHIAGTLENYGGQFSNGDCQAFVGIPIRSDNNDTYTIRIYSTTDNHKQPQFLDSVIAEEKKVTSDKGLMIGHTWYLAAGTYQWEIVNNSTGKMQSNFFVLNCGTGNCS